MQAVVASKLETDLEALGLTGVEDKLQVSTPCQTPTPPTSLSLTLSLTKTLAGCLGLHRKTCAARWKRYATPALRSGCSRVRWHDGVTRKCGCVSHPKRGFCPSFVRLDGWTQATRLRRPSTLRSRPSSSSATSPFTRSAKVRDAPADVRRGGHKRAHVAREPGTRALLFASDDGAPGCGRAGRTAWPRRLWSGD